MKNKVIILLVRRHAGEVDWILPLLYKFKLKKYKIITIFSENISYESLKNNKEIYNIWKKISANYYILNKYDLFFWKILHKLSLKFYFINKKISKWVEKKTLNKIFSINKFQKKLKFHIKDVKAVFAPNVYLSNLPIFFKKYNPKLSIIRFPESAMISASKIQNPKLEYNLSFRKIVGDLFLFSSKSDKEFLLSINKKKNIYYCGYLRHQKWWIRKFLSHQKNNKTFNVLIAVRNPQKNYLHESIFIEMMETLMNVLSKINNIKITFKIHPQDKNLDLLNNILMKYNKKIWEYKKSHMLTLSSESDVCIAIITSACLDSLAVGIPTLEYYKINSELKISSNITHCVHMAYTRNKWRTIFNVKRLVNTVETYEQLNNNINLIYRNQYQKINNINQLYFKKLITINKNNTDETLNYIENNYFTKV